MDIFNPTGLIRHATPRYQVADVVWPSSLEVKCLFLAEQVSCLFPDKKANSQMLTLHYAHADTLKPCGQVLVCFWFLN